MRYGLIDADAQSGTVGQVAYHYIRWELEQLGAVQVDPADADVVLVTAVAAQEWRAVPRALRRAGIEPSREKRGQQPLVVLGGQAAMAPTIFDSIVDVACVGEGRRFLQTLARSVDAAMELPNAWVPGETREVVPDTDAPWDMPPVMGVGGTVRVLGSRGCKRRCLFCQIGWQMPYSENDQKKLARQIAALRLAGHRVDLITNDASVLGVTYTDAFSGYISATYDQLRAMLRTTGMPKTRSVRIGVEAPSERLRAAVGKPVDTEGLYALTREFLSAGIGVRWFMIAGLPGELDEDYEELRDIVLRARHDIRKGAIQLSFTAFCPESAAPLGLAPLTDDYHERYVRFHEWYFSRANTRRIQLFKAAGPESRLEHAIGSMGCTEAELRRGWDSHDPPNWRIVYYHRGSIRRAWARYRRAATL